MCRRLLSLRGLAVLFTSIALLAALGGGAASAASVASGPSLAPRVAIELQTIVDETAYTPSINTVAFPNTPLEYFWTSSLVPGRSSAFVVNFDRGYTDANQDATQNQYRARCVR